MPIGGPRVSAARTLARLVDGSDGRARRLVRDLAFASLGTAVILALWLAAGGVWDHVNSGDLHAQALPKYEEAVRSIFGELRIPLWNPYEFCGLPLLGAGLGAVLYPPVPLIFAALSPRSGLQALFGLHVLVLMWGTIAYLRGHGVSRTGGIVAAAVALAAMLRGLLYTAIDHPHWLNGVAWMPWLLLCAERAACRDAAWIAVLGGVFALQCLTGNPDVPMDSAVLVVVATVVATPQRRLRGVARVAMGLALGGLLAAVQLLPIADTVAQSQRADMLAGYPDWRRIFEAATLGQSWSGWVFRYGPALPIAATALIRPTRVRVAWAVAFGFGLFALSFPLNLIYRLPPFDGIRFPLGWGYLEGVWIGCLAAITLASLARWGAVGRVVACALGIAVLIHAARVVAWAPTAPRYTGERGAPDYALVAVRSQTLGAFARANGVPRVLSERESVAAAPLRHRFLSATGVEPSVAPARIVHLLEAIDLFDPMGVYGGRRWRRLAARPWVAARLGIGLVTVPARDAKTFHAAGFRAVGILPPGDVMLTASAVPRARLVHRVSWVPDARASLAAVLDPATDPYTVAVLEEPQSAFPIAVPGADAAAERATVTVDLPERVEVAVEAAAPGLLVLADTFFSGWRARVDGRAAPILLTDHAFRGVPVPAGRHRVEFEYAPASFRIGALISLAALLAAAVLVARRRVVEPAPDAYAPGPAAEPEVERPFGTGGVDVSGAITETRAQLDGRRRDG